MSPDENPLLEPAPDDPSDLPEPSARPDLSDEPGDSGEPAPRAEPQAAASTAADGVLPPRWFGVDRRLVVGAAAVVALLVLFFGVLLGKARHDLDALRGELVALRGELHRSQAIRDRGAVLRMRAELQTLRQTLPADLSADVEAADAALRRLDERLKAAP